MRVRWQCDFSRHGEMAPRSYCLVGLVQSQFDILRRRLRRPLPSTNSGNNFRIRLLAVSRSVYAVSKNFSFTTPFGVT